MKAFGAMTLLMATLQLSQISFAQELDRESSVTNQRREQLAKDLPSTLVVRIHEKTNEASVLHSKQPLKESEESLKEIDQEEFRVLPSTQDELDRDSSQESSWRFGVRISYGGGYYPWYGYSYYNYYPWAYYPSYYYPHYYYGGYYYAYRPYYSYYFPPYYYHYYRR